MHKNSAPLNGKMKNGPITISVCRSGVRVLIVYTELVKHHSHKANVLLLSDYSALW